MKFEDANDLLKPGYLPFESGYWELDEGKWVVAGLSRMTGCRAKMVDWWFSWLDDIDWYRLWHPTDHVYSAWENRVDGKYVGASHLVHEYLAGKDGPLYKLRIDFHDPSETFDREKYRASGALAVCARPGLLEAPFHVGRMCHYVRDTDYGCEMRSRFWLGMISHRDPTITLPQAQVRQMRAENLDAEFARRLHQHCIEEMGYLAEILPALYRRITLDNSF
jgi:hypothetical protein